jgi:hypothetical protein
MDADDGFYESLLEPAPDSLRGNVSDPRNFAELFRASGKNELIGAPAAPL